ncbi:MAG: FeoA domain-containing protein [Bacillota bacterium]
MCSRNGGTLLTRLSSAPKGVPLVVVRVLRPARLPDRVWKPSLLRLEELGIFQGQPMERTGSTGPLGSAVVRVGGARVALSRDLTESVLVRVLP